MPLFLFWSLFLRIFLQAEEFPKSLTSSVQTFVELLGPKDVCYVGFSPDDKTLLFQEALRDGEASEPRNGAGGALISRECSQSHIWISTPCNEEGYSPKEWLDENKANTKILSCFPNASKGKVLYVVPYLLGKIGSLSLPVLQVTDSPLIALAALTMGKTGKEVLPFFEKEGFIKSISCKQTKGQNTSFLITMPKKQELWTSGGAVTIDQIRQEIVLRLSSSRAQDEGWLVAHMSLFSLMNPEGEKRFGLFLLPESLSSLHLMQATLPPAWQLEILSTDTSWVFMKERRLMALNPEKQLAGTLCGRVSSTLQKRLLSCGLFSNVVWTEEGDMWWQDKEPVTPWKLSDGKKKEVSGFHQKAFFALPHDKKQEEVPISLVVILSLEKKIYPLVQEGLSWSHGMLMASLLASPKVHTLYRFDPFAMKSCCGRNLGEYIETWMQLEDRLSPKERCRFFTVNIAPREKGGYPLSCLDMLTWCFDRCGKQTEAQPVPFGFIPRSIDVDTQTIDPTCSFNELFSRNKGLWQKELLDLKFFLKRWDESIPHELTRQILFYGCVDDH